MPPILEFGLRQGLSFSGGSDKRIEDMKYKEKMISDAHDRAAAKAKLFADKIKFPTMGQSEYYNNLIKENSYKTLQELGKMQTENPAGDTDPMFQLQLQQKADSIFNNPTVVESKLFDTESDKLRAELGKKENASLIDNNLFQPMVAQQEQAKKTGEPFKFVHPAAGFDYNDHTFKLAKTVPKNILQKSPDGMSVTELADDKDIRSAAILDLEGPDKIYLQHQYDRYLSDFEQSQSDGVPISKEQWNFDNIKAKIQKTITPYKPYKTGDADSGKIKLAIAAQDQANKMAIAKAKQDFQREKWEWDKNNGRGAGHPEPKQSSWELAYEKADAERDKEHILDPLGVQNMLRIPGSNKFIDGAGWSVKLQSEKNEDDKEYDLGQIPNRQFINPRMLVDKDGKNYLKASVLLDPKNAETLFHDNNVVDLNSIPWADYLNSWTGDADLNQNITSVDFNENGKIVKKLQFDVYKEMDEDQREFYKKSYDARAAKVEPTKATTTPAQPVYKTYTGAKAGFLPIPESLKNEEIGYEFTDKNGNSYRITNDGLQKI